MAQRLMTRRKSHPLSQLLSPSLSFPLPRFCFFFDFLLSLSAEMRMRYLNAFLDPVFDFVSALLSLRIQVERLTSPKVARLFFLTIF